MQLPVYLFFQTLKLLFFTELRTKDLAAHTFWALLWSSKLQHLSIRQGQYHATFSTQTMVHRYGSAAHLIAQTCACTYIRKLHLHRHGQVCRRVYYIEANCKQTIWKDHEWPRRPCLELHEELVLDRQKLCVSRRACTCVNVQAVAGR